NGFDVSISDTLVTLLAGGCICVPSDLERSNDLPGAVARMDVNFADLTPSVLQSLSPADVPSIRTLVLGCEAMTQTMIAKWSGQVCLLNAYGPAELCMLSTLQPNVSMIDPSNIGYATGGACWAVDKVDATKLMPIGAVGELLIEGPVVGRGYIIDPEKTAASFVEDLGGDSILAMKAAALARSRGIKLTVRAIFEHRQLRRLAEALSAASELPGIENLS
ncbi:hypothetical protein IFM60648_09964, partial [Aspergillus lentulus]